jgi:hypothetical protein
MRAFNPTGEGDWKSNEHNGIMAIVESGFVHQQKIIRGIEKAAATLASEVVRIRHNFGEDWSGEGAVFFRVVLKDTASKRSQLREVARRVSSVILDEVKPQELGLQSYFNFRSESEQAELKEESWV